MDRQPDPQSSFDFSFTVDGDDPATLPGKVCRLQTATDLDVNEAAGVSLAGDAIHLLPKALRAEFSGTYPDLTVTLDGQFVREASDHQPVRLSGAFAVHAVDKTAK
jgi:hypothetical protein